MKGRFPVPSYMPAEGLAVVPWARRQVAALSKKARIDPGDAWDEAVTALLRACVHFKPGAGTFVAYAKVAVTRGLWRYALPDKLFRHNRRPVTISLEDASGSLDAVPSSEDIAIAREEVANRLKEPPDPDPQGARLRA